MYGSMFQYQARAEPVGIPTPTRPWASEPLLELLPFLLLGSFDCPHAEPAAETFTLPAVHAPFIEEAPSEILGWFDRPLDDSSRYASWSQPESVQLPALPDPLQEQWLAFVQRDEGPAGIPWLDTHPALEEIPAEALGSFSAPFSEAAAEVFTLPLLEPPFLHELDPEALGSSDRPLDDASAYGPWRQPESVQLPELPWPLPEEWLSIVQRDEIAAAIPWIDLQPSLMALPDEALGSFERPLDQPAAEVFTAPTIPEPFLEELPAELLGSFSTSPDDASRYAAWLQPESVGLPPIPDQQQEAWLAFVARNTEPDSISWHDVQAYLHELPAEQLGSFDSPFEESAPVLFTHIDSIEPFLTELTPEILGSFDRPILPTPTRFYFDSAGIPTVTPAAAGAEWEHFSQSAVRRLNNPKGSSALATSTTTYDSADHIVDQDALHRQFVSRPLAAQTINAQPIKAQALAAEGNAGNNLFVAVKVYLIDQAGLAVGGGTLLSITRDTVNEVVVTTLTNRAFTATTSSVSASAGDRLCVEIGLGGLPVAAGGVQDHDGSLRFGESAGSDLTEDDSSTSDLNPWLEFRDNLTLLDEPMPPPGLSAPEHLELLPFELLGSFDSPLAEPAVAVNVLPFTADQTIQPLPDEILGSFDRPTFDPAAAVITQPLWQGPEFDPLPAEILGSSDRSPDDAAIYAAWRQPESVQIPELAAPQCEQWAAFVPADDRTVATSWLDVHPQFLELPAQPLGSFDAPIGVPITRFEPTPPLAEELPYEALGSFSSPLAEPFVAVADFLPASDQNQLAMLLPEILGASDRYSPLWPFQAGGGLIVEYDRTINRDVDFDATFTRTVTWDADMHQIVSYARARKLT